MIWETIGGETTKMLFKHLAIRGRLIIIGGIVGYLNHGFPIVQFQNVPVI